MTKTPEVHELRHTVRSLGPMTRAEEEAKARIWRHKLDIRPASGWEHITGEPDFYFLSMTIRARNCMRAAGIERLAQIQSMTDKQLLALRGVGKTVLAELRGLREEDLRAALEEYFGPLNDAPSPRR